MAGSLLLCRTKGILQWSALVSARQTRLNWDRFLSHQAAPPNKTALIKELRERTGAPIVDVKSSLVAFGWDLQAATDALHAKGLAAAAKRASRAAADGLLCIAQRPGAAVVVEVNSETDFVARSAVFQGLVREAARAALGLADVPRSAAGGWHEKDVRELRAARPPGGGRSLDESCAEVAAAVRENVSVRRVFHVDAPAAPAGVLGTYLHQSQEGSEGLGRIAALVVLQAEDGAPLPSAGSGGVSLPAAALGLATHVAGMKPRFVARSDVPADVVAQTRQALQEAAASEGGPADAAALEGRLASWFAEQCLLEQPYLLDGTLRVGQALQRWSPEGRQLVVTAMLRVQLGEGLDVRPKLDFATEVQQMLQKSA